MHLFWPKNVKCTSYQFLIWINDEYFYILSWLNKFLVNLNICNTWLFIKNYIKYVNAVCEVSLIMDTGISSTFPGLDRWIWLIFDASQSLPKQIFYTGNATADLHVRANYQTTFLLKWHFLTNICDTDGTLFSYGLYYFSAWMTDQAVHGIPTSK